MQIWWIWTLSAHLESLVGGVIKPLWGRNLQEELCHWVQALRAHALSTSCPHLRLSMCGLKKTISQLPASAVTVPLIGVMPFPTRTRRNPLFPKLFWAAILAPQWEVIMQRSWTGPTQQKTTEVEYVSRNLHTCLPLQRSLCLKN